MIEKIRKVMRGEKGFTLVEMMVVLIIIAVLIAIGIRAYIGYIGSSKMTKAKGDITTMQAALDSYYSQNGVYPNSANAITTAGITMASYTGLVPVLGALGTYTYGYESAAGNASYSLWTVTSVSGQYEVGTGGLGISQVATGLGAVPTN
jgi:general secretion pathway protein G